MITMIEDINVVAPRKKMCFETWGCQMNVADSERMLGLMAQQSYDRTEDPKEADLIVLNTCHIREKAYHKVMSRLGVLKDLKISNPGLTIAVTGCVAQAEGRRLIEDANMIDVLIGPGRLDELPQLVAKHKETHDKSLAVGFPKLKTGPLPAPTDETTHGEAACLESQTLSGKNEVSRFVNIQQGCNNYCTFCVVPFTRGGEISEYPESIIAKIKGFLRRGAKEIVLLGQNVNSYGSDLGIPFVDLIHQVAALRPYGLERLKFTTSNPHDFTKSLAQCFAQYPELMGRYLHLPVQSGNDRVLGVMKRKVTVAEYKERVEWLRGACPDMALSTDLIVGFPGETRSEFEDTLHLVQTIGFGFIFAFAYSPRKGTAAVRFGDHISETEKKQRLRELNLLQDRITEGLHQREVGHTRQVLFLYRSQKNPTYMFGRTEHFRLVRVASPRSDLLGQILPVHILSSNKVALTGVLAS